MTSYNQSITPEAKFEQSILNYLQSQQGYEYITPSEMKVSYDKKYALDTKRLLRFIEHTQPISFTRLRLDTVDGRESFFKLLEQNIKTYSIVNVLKNGIVCHDTIHITLFYHTINNLNKQSQTEFNSNIFAVSNQFTYSSKHPGKEIDLVIFINGLPVMTMELKSLNSSAKYTYKDAENQYRNDRDVDEVTLCSFKCCIAHFAVDECNVSFTTELRGQDTVFMPFNKGLPTGDAGNPPSLDEHGSMTDYLWKEILSKPVLASLIKDFVYLSQDKVKSSKNKVIERLIFPRYHQYRVVKNLITDVATQKVGKRYLIQHSAGSGKSNSISWLAYQLVEVKQQDNYVFDTVIVITDRLNLDEQIYANILKQSNVKSILARANSSKDLANNLANGKKINITTIQKFLYIVGTIGDQLKNKKFAIIIDEAHSSQGGCGTAAVNQAVSGLMSNNSDLEIEDKINNLIASRQMPNNASFFAFTATPKSRTLEMFGQPFDLYSMKQAIKEHFILDVLKNYTTYKVFYSMLKTIVDDPLVDKKKATRTLRLKALNNPSMLKDKAEIMVNHFLDNSVSAIGGKAKAMVITSSIEAATNYYFEISKLLAKDSRKFKALVAFSGEKQIDGVTYTEASLNGCSDTETVKEFKKDEYKFLIVADKYQTGYDEPLLHTMYVDKPLHGVNAVQTLSRLNRCCYSKIDTCVLDFVNDSKDIQEAFQPYYQQTVIETNSSPQELQHILDSIDSTSFYSKDDVNELVITYLNGNSIHDTFELNATKKKVAMQFKQLSDLKQVEVKSLMNTFINTYSYLSLFLPITTEDFLIKNIFFTQIINWLETPLVNEDDVNIDDSVSLLNYRIEKQHQLDILLGDSDGILSTSTVSSKPKPVELPIDKLSNIVSMFSEKHWKDEQAVNSTAQEIPDLMLAHEKLRNAFENSDIESMKREIPEIFKLTMRQSIMSQNHELFRACLKDSNFNQTLLELVTQVLVHKYLQHHNRASNNNDNTGYNNLL